MKTYYCPNGMNTVTAILSRGDVRNIYAQIKDIAPLTVEFQAFQRTMRDAEIKLAEQAAQQGNANVVPRAPMNFQNEDEFDEFVDFDD